MPCTQYGSWACAAVRRWTDTWVCGCLSGRTVVLSIMGKGGQFGDAQLPAQRAVQQDCILCASRRVCVGKLSTSSTCYCLTAWTGIWRREALTQDSQPSNSYCFSVLWLLCPCVAPAILSNAARCSGRAKSLVVDRSFRAVSARRQTPAGDCVSTKR